MKTIRKTMTQYHDSIPVDDIAQNVIDIISDVLGYDKPEITYKCHYINDFNIDSLDSVELVTEFEDKFDIEIPDEEAAELQTVGLTIEYIKRKTESANI